MVLPRHTPRDAGGAAIAFPLIAVLGFLLGACADSTGAGSSRLAMGDGRPAAAGDPGGGPEAVEVTVIGEGDDDRARVRGRFPGSDRLTAVPGRDPVSLVPVDGSAGGPISLNFVETDVREVVKAVLGDTLGQNYIIDPGVQGTVTFQTSKPLSREDLAAALDEILSLNGAALVQSDGLYKVVPADQAARAGVTTRGAAPGLRGVGARALVAPLRYIPAAEMETILQPFAPPNTILRVDPERNLLVLGGTQSQREQLLEIIEIFDVDWLRGMSFAIHEIESTSPETMVGELETIFSAGTSAEQNSLVRFVPIERLNAVLVISPRRAMLARAETWITRLDIGDSTKPRVYVYYAQNSRAQELADVLNQIFTGAAPQRTTTAETPRSLAPGLSPAEIGETSLRESIQLARVDGAAFQADAAPAPVSGGADAGRRRGSGGGSLGATESEVRIIADTVKNAVVIMATPQDFKKIEAALRRLDIQSLQVLIEATFIEVGLTDDLAFGTEWLFRTGSSEVELPQLISTATSAGSVFSWALALNNDDIRVTIQAIQNLTEVNIVSSPNLLVLDNQEARIQVGGEEPVPTRSSVSVTDPDAPIVSSIEYRETGTIMTVTPRVNESGLVTLELAQEVSDVGETVEVGGTTAPTFNQRTVQSTIAVHDGESIVLGGQIFESDQRTRSGVPFLSQIPILGFLFGTQGSTFERTELIVIITPRVIRDRETARDATETLNQRMQRLRPILEEFRVREGFGGT